MGRLSGKVAAITGGASGIGEATARRFAEEGAHVAIADVDAERGRVVAAEIGATGGRAIFREMHAAREAECAAFVQAARQELGRLDILVNNAGMRLYQTVVEASEASWDAILGVNVKGYAFCAKAAIPFMREAGGGSIVNVASIRAVVAGGRMVQYDTTKAAVAGLTRAMALDHAAEGIRVNAVRPGIIDTEIHATSGHRERVDASVQLIPMARLGTAQEVARSVVWLLSDEAGYVSGALLDVAGGR